MLEKSELTELLKTYGQTHLMQFWDELSAPEQRNLADQIGSIEFEELAAQWSGKSTSQDWARLASRAEQPPAIRTGQQPDSFSNEEAIKAGEKAISEGTVAAILVAGGQGTRLGFPQPKGMFPVGPVSKRTLFEMHFDRLTAVRQRYGADIPFLIMTSPATHAETVEFLSANNRFGLPENDVWVFCQGTMPAIDAETGKILLANRSGIALSPDGHGGIVAALQKSGLLDRASQRGIEHFFYGQVDNPLVEHCDPHLIGAHILSQSQITTQVVKKRFAAERVGNVVEIDGRVQIIEYSDLPQEIAELTDDQGELKFWAGNIAVHVFDRSFLASVAAENSRLPFHRAHKVVPYVDGAGQTVKPESPNAIKLEKFVFDLLPLAENSIVIEGDAREVFAPVKNAPGAETDTALTCQRAISDLHGSWLKQAGIEVPAESTIEIHPCWAIDADQVAEKCSDMKPQITEMTYLH